MVNPLVSIVVPTLNAERVLEECLTAISAQRVSSGSIELLVVDAGSSDRTRTIALRHGARMLNNPLRTGEAGKMIGLRAARGDIVAFVDSDNVLPGEDWLERMLVPFSDKSIVGAEPIRYLARPSDGYLTRYFARLGMGDPFCLFGGNYDRHCEITGRWTSVPHVSTLFPGYMKVWFPCDRLPTIGANGFLVRRSAMLGCVEGDYLFDVDAIQSLLRDGQSTFAKTDCGIIHVFAGSVDAFRRKQRRRVVDYLHYRRRGMRSVSAGQIERRSMLLFAVSVLTGWPLVVQTIYGLCRSGDLAWFFHPAACALTLFEYGRAMLFGGRNASPLERRGWMQ